MTEEEVKTILRNIPNAVSGDGKPFVAALKNYLSKYGAVTDEKIDEALEELRSKPAHVTNITLLELHAITDGVRSNNIQVSWDITPVEDYAKAEVWYKTNEDDSTWQKAGEASGTQYVIQGAETGKTYYICVVAVNSKGNTADFDTAPQASIKIKGSQYIPSPPTQFVLTWDEQGPLWKWLFTDNNYIDFFELRLDQNPGVWNENRLDSTRETWSRVAPNTRSGTAYLYIRNIFGEYSEPAVHQFSKGQPGKPSAPILTSTLDGVRIKMESLPQGNTKYRLFIKTVDGNETNEGYFETANSEYIYFFFAGTITVMYQIVDPLGVGEWSDEVTANVKDLIVDADNIADGAITNDKIAANAVTAAKIAANSITGDKIAANAIDADNIAAGAINAKHLAAGSVGAEAIQAGSIVGDKIATGAITAANMAANSVTSNAILAGSIDAEKLKAGDIDLLGALAIVGGAARLDKDGLKITDSDGGYIQYNSDGMSYYDSNNYRYAQVKRMVIGSAKHGRHITFNHPWAYAPIVLCSPTDTQIAQSTYQQANIKLVCTATNVTKNGFDIQCYTTLMSGSGSGTSNSKTLTGSTEAQFSFSLPSTATNISVPLTISANISKSTGTFKYYYKNNYGNWVTNNSTSTGDVYPWVYATASLKVNNSEKSSWQSSTIYSKQGNTALNATTTLNATFSAGSTITVTVQLHYGFQNNMPSTANYQWRYVSGGKVPSGTANTSSNYSTSTNQVISTGTAFFLCIDANSSAYTIS